MPSRVVIATVICFFSVPPLKASNVGLRINLIFIVLWVYIFICLLSHRTRTCSVLQTASRADQSRTNDKNKGVATGLNRNALPNSKHSQSKVIGWCDFLTPASALLALLGGLYDTVKEKLKLYYV